MKKIIATILIISMCLCLSVSASAENISDLSDEILTEKCRLYHIEIDPFNELFDESMHGDFFFDENCDIYLNVVPEKLTSEMVAYISESNRRLMKNPLTQKGIQIVKAKYTLKELKEIQNKAIKYFSPYGLSGSGIDISTQEIEIELTTLFTPTFSSENFDYQYRNILNIKYAGTLQQTEHKSTSNTIGNESLPNSVAIKVNPATLGYSGGMGATFSWGVRYNGKTCYLFCGHNMTKGNAVFSNGVNVGNIVNIFLGGVLDCSFIERADSAKSIGIYLPNGRQLPYGTPSTNYKYNELINMYGGVTGHTTGRIKIVSGTSGVGLTTIRDVIKADLSSRSGDSGAPIYNSAPIGILSGWESASGYSIIIPLKNIVSGTGMSLAPF